LLNRSVFTNCRELSPRQEWCNGALKRTLKFMRRYLVEHTDEQVGEHDPLRAGELCSLEAPV